MKEYLTFDKDNNHHINEEKIIDDFTKLYINSIKVNSEVGYGNLIAHQIGGIMFLSVIYGLFFLLGALVNEYIFKFVHFIPDNAYFILLIICFFSINVIITKYKVEDIKETICREGIGLGLSLYRNTLLETKEKLKTNEFNKMIENDLAYSNRKTWNDFHFTRLYQVKKSEEK